MTRDPHKPRAIVPLTNIARQDPGSPSGVVPDVDGWFLTVLGEQARLAISHLSRVWAREGDPPDLSVWQRMNPEADAIWGDLQAALFAGIVVSRILKPSEKISDAALAERARKRGEALRQLCHVPNGSPLTALGPVRNAFEHLDERMDKVAHSGDVASVSDLAIATGGRFVTLSQAEARRNGASVRHVNMRLFSPDVGFLIYDNHQLDLWAWETALLDLLVAVRDAHSGVLASSMEKKTYGAARLVRWDSALAADRRSQILEIRAQVKADGNWLIRPHERPGTVVSVWDLPEADA